MHDDDDALWTGQGGDAELEGIERTLGVLRWRPRELALGGAAAEARVIETVPSERRRGWVPVLAAVFAAAAVFVLLVWLRLAARVEPAPVEVHPVAPPSSEGRETSADLKDPFARPDADQQPGDDAPVPELSPGTSPDLKDPFAGSRREPPKRERKPDASDLKDPFERSRSDDLVDPFKPAPKLQDPFGGAPKPVDPDSPDLKDPFRGD